MIKVITYLKTRYLKKGSFAVNVATLSTGTVISQIIVVAVSPLLTRLYSSSDFGVYALYLAIASVVTVIATGRYELAIVLPKADEDAAHLILLSLIINFCVCFLFFLTVCMFHDPIVMLLGNQTISFWLYFVPLGIFLMATYQVFNYWFNRQKMYKKMSQNRVMQSGITIAVQLGIGVLTNGINGLIVGTIIGYLITTAMLIITSCKQILNYKFGLARIKSISQHYIGHPKLLVPSHVIASLSGQVPVFFINSFFGTETTGFFSLASRCLSLPSSLIANAIGDVFRQRASEDYRRFGQFSHIYVKTLKSTFLISFLPFILIYLCLPFIFTAVFGAAWEKSGEYARVLIISTYFSFVLTPTDKAALIVGATRYIFWWHFFRLIANVLIALMSFKLNYEVAIYLYLLVVINICLYIVEGIAGYKFCKGT